MDCIARSSLGNIPDLQRLLQYFETTTRSRTEETRRLTQELLAASIAKGNLAKDLEMLELSLDIERHEHEGTRTDLGAEIVNQQRTIDELQRQLATILNEHRNLKVGCRNRVRDLKEAKDDLCDLQTENDSLLQERNDARAVADRSSATLEDLLSKYNTLLEAYKDSGNVIKELVDESKKGLVTHAVASPGTGNMVLSTANFESLRGGLKTNFSILVEQKEDLQREIGTRRRHEALREEQVRELLRVEADLRQEVRILKDDQMRHLQRLGELEEKRISRDERIQTLELEQKVCLQDNHKLTEKLQGKNDQLDKAACGTLASIAILDDMKKSNDVLKKNVRVLQHESDALWNFLLEHSIDAHDVAEQRSCWEMAWLSEIAWRRAQEVAMWINESHKSYYILH